MQSTQCEQKISLSHPLWALLIKRLCDVLFSLLVLLLIWPIIIFVAIAIKLTSPGPVFYRGIRTGLHGIPFRILKFRTMVVDAESLGARLRVPTINVLLQLVLSFVNKT